ncbi:MAG TPA: glucosamine-6-phosphate deaminase [Actinomycetota bacterium]
MTGLTPTVVDGPAAAGVAAADAIGSVIEANPAAAVVVATGRTPMDTYRVLADRATSGLETSRLRVFQLDEYVGVAPDDDRSLSGWMDRSFVGPLGIDPSSVVRLDALAPDHDAICAGYEHAVGMAGGFDLAILGLGPNGHLGFNEPPSDQTSPTRVVDLTDESLASNTAYWGPGRVPSRALTAGMDLLLAARRVVLIVTGDAKRDILRRALTEPPTPSVPASFLQDHPDTLVIADRAAWGR